MSMVFASRKNIKNRIEELRTKINDSIPAREALEDLQTIEREITIIDKRDRKIIELLNRNEVFFLTEIITLNSLPDAERACKLKRLYNSGMMNRTALLLFLALYKDDLDVEIFDLLTRQALINDGGTGFDFSDNA